LPFCTLGKTNDTSHVVFQRITVKITKEKSSSIKKEKSSSITKEKRGSKREEKFDNKREVRKNHERNLMPTLEIMTKGSIGHSIGTHQS
jgi:hypothetical protein